MIDVFIDDDTVVVGVPRLFTRPLRLTAPEGFALVAAGRAAMQLPGRRPRRVRSGAGCRSSPRRSATTASSSTSRSRPALEQSIAVVGRRGASMPSGCEVEYWTPSRDEVTTRTITPRRVFNDRGEWYVVADDGRSGERRTFRIDRFESIEPTGEHDPCHGRSRCADPVRPSGSPTAGCPGSMLRLTRGGALGRRALSGRRRRRSSTAAPCGPRSPSPASVGWSGCSCGWAPTRPERRVGAEGPTWRAALRQSATIARAGSCARCTTRRTVTVHVTPVRRNVARRATLCAMGNEIEIHGHVAPGWQAVADLLAASIERGEDVGASVAVYHRGQCVVDIAGGSFHADGGDYDRQTLQLVFSTTKGITALAAAMCVERGLLDYDAPVSGVLAGVRRRGQGRSHGGPAAQPPVRVDHGRRHHPRGGARLGHRDRPPCRHGAGLADRQRPRVPRR